MIKASRAPDKRSLNFESTTSVRAWYSIITTDSQHSKPVASDLLKQDFHAGTPKKLTTDITYVWTAEGWLYLAVVLDRYARAIVGWAINCRMTQHLVSGALTITVLHRQFPKNNIVHSGQGSQYCSTGYQQLCRSNAALLQHGAQSHLL